MIINIPKNSDFSIHNIPFGIFSVNKRKTRVGVAIGDHILDLYAVAELGLFEDLRVPKSIFSNEFLNDFIALGKPITNAVRLRIQKLLSSHDSPLIGEQGIFVNQSDAIMHLPVKIGDYTDFYSSIEHATNIGTMFRDPDKALLPNWRHMPVGYHGRSSSIVVSGTPIHRPNGQTIASVDQSPIFGPSKRMDFELEMAFIVGKQTKLGDAIPIAEAEDHIFGMVLFNDWSARDIQKWEYVPLGPFLAKSVGSSISPWVVTMEALEPFKVLGPSQEPQVLPYLQYEGKQNYDINLEVSLQPEDSHETKVCSSNYKYMYWNMSQQLAHHTVNGCNVNVGDMMASGTISGKDKSSYGSLLELSWGGDTPIDLTDGNKRIFIEDGDTIIMKGYAEKDNKRVGFGEVKGKLLAAK